MAASPQSVENPEAQRTVQHGLRGEREDPLQLWTLKLSRVVVPHLEQASDYQEVLLQQIAGPYPLNF